MFWFTSSSCCKGHELGFFQAWLKQKWWFRSTPNLFKLLMDNGNTGSGSNEPEINSPGILVVWALNPLQLLFCALDLLLQGCTTHKYSHHMYPLKQSRALNMIAAKNIDGPCRKIQSHYLSGPLTNNRHKVMNHLFTPLKQFYFDFI